MIWLYKGVYSSFHSTRKISVCVGASGPIPNNTRIIWKHGFHPNRHQFNQTRKRSSPCIYIKHINYPDQPSTLEFSTSVTTDYYESQLWTFVPVQTSTPIPKYTFKIYLIPIPITFALVYDILYLY